MVREAAPERRGDEIAREVAESAADAILDILGRSYSVFFPEEEVARGRPQALLEAAAAAGSAHTEGWRVRRDGTRIHADVCLSALRRDDGTLRGFVKITRDVTERRRSEYHRSSCDEVSPTLSVSFHDYELALRALAHLAVRELADVCIVDRVDEKGELRRFEVACTDAHDEHLAADLRSSAARPERASHPHQERARGAPSETAPVAGSQPKSVGIPSFRRRN